MNAARKPPATKLSRNKTIAPDDPYPQDPNSRPCRTPTKNFMGELNANFQSTWIKSHLEFLISRMFGDTYPPRSPLFLCHTRAATVNRNEQALQKELSAVAT